MIRFTFIGLDRVQDGLDEMVGELVDELRPGFIPLRQYRGERGGIFTLEKIDLLARQKGFDIHGDRFG